MSGPVASVRQGLDENERLAAEQRIGSLTAQAEVLKEEIPLGHDLESH